MNEQETIQALVQVGIWLVIMIFVGILRGFVYRRLGCSEGKHVPWNSYGWEGKTTECESCRKTLIYQHGKWITRA